jgi:prepilin signal peptidase PulO-like enzyme (type II secretory pathway)
VCGSWKLVGGGVGIGVVDGEGVGMLDGVADGLVFVSVFLKTLTLAEVSLGTSVFYMIFYMYVFALLIVVSVYDYHHKILPDKLVWLFNLLALISTTFVFQGGFTIAPPSLWQLLAGPLIALPFFLLWFFSRGRGMGFGDVKLALGIGWLLGISQAIAAVVFSFWIGAIVGVILLLLKNKKFGMKTQVPFGPFMCIATCLVFIFSVTIGDIILRLHIKGPKGTCVFIPNLLFFKRSKMTPTIAPIQKENTTAAIA